MENEMNAAILAGLYLGWILVIIFLGWGLFELGAWMERKAHARYLAKTRELGKISIYYHN